MRDWDEYVSRVETDNKVKLDDEFKLQIFTEVFLEGEQDIYYDDYRLSKDEDTEIEWEKDDSVSSVPTAKISSLLLTKENREEFIKAANRSFERIVERIEPDNPELTRSLWDAEHYIDEKLLKPEMLPIDRDYALSLVDAFLVGYVIQLAAQADDQAGQPN